MNNERLKIIMEKYGLSKQDVARITKSSERTVDSWRTGGKSRRRIPDSKAQLILNYIRSDKNTGDEDSSSTSEDVIPYKSKYDNGIEEDHGEDVVSVLRELLREREKRLEEKDEFIEYLKRENTELRARLSDAGSGEAV